MSIISKIDGLPVKDADDHLEVKITAADVRRGAKKDATACAAAHAICRQGGYEEARVHASRVFVRDGNAWLRYVTPTALRHEIIAFDRGGSFEPGVYTLNRVQPSQRIGEREKRPTIAPKHPPKKGRIVKKRPYHITTGIRKRFEATR